VRNKRVLLRALEIYGTSNLDFGDAMILAAMEQAGSAQLYSYDQDFDTGSGVTRIEP
jgi:predicted nucleic acid-binding protein